MVMVMVVVVMVMVMVMVGKLVQEQTAQLLLLWRA